MIETIRCQFGMNECTPIQESGKSWGEVAMLTIIERKAVIILMMDCGDGVGDYTYYLLL